jgi:hypothetical protein
MSNTAIPAPVHLNGRSLFTGHLLYALLLLLCVAMFGLSLSFKFAQGTSGCDSTYNAEWAAQGQWCAEWFQAIEEIGVTAVAFESYFLALRLLVALPFFALSLLLVWRRGQELRVLLFAGLLLLMGIAGTWFNPFWGWAEGWSYPAVDRLSQLLTYSLNRRRGAVCLLVSRRPFCTPLVALAGWQFLITLCRQHFLSRHKCGLG